MSSAVRARSNVGREIIRAVGRKDRGMDVWITVVPEADAVTPDGVIVDIVNGEWPVQRPDPTISAVAMSPPPVRGAAAMPACQRRSRDELPAQRRVAYPGIHDVADVLRSEGSRSDAAVTRKAPRVMQPRDRQYAGDCEPRDPKGTDGKTHPRQRRTRQHGCQNDNGNSYASLRHGTLPRQALSRHTDDGGYMTPEGTKSSIGASNDYYVLGGRLRLTAWRRGERATRGCSRLTASRPGFFGACGPRANSISMRSASTTERRRTALRPIAPKRCSRCRIRPSRAATAKCTRPTGLPGVAPPGPAIPVMETARSTPAFSSAPIAIAVAVSLLTAPNAESVVALTPSIARLASLE